MTTNEAIQAMQFYQEKLYNGIYRQYIGAFDLAIAALKAQQKAEKNDPLTLEELREMDGEPVWVSDYSDHSYTGWALVRAWHKYDGDIYLVCGNGKIDLAEFVIDYGGHIYRHKPQEVEV